DPIVSSDVRGSTYSGVFDSLATMVIDGTMVKTITRFNNGWGYSARVVEVIERLSANLIKESRYGSEGRNQRIRSDRPGCFPDHRRTPRSRHRRRRHQRPRRRRGRSEEHTS